MVSKRAQEEPLNGKPQTAQASNSDLLAQILAEIGGDSSNITRDVACRAICTWALLLGQYQGSQSTSFALRSGHVPDSLEDQQQRRQPQTWLIGAEYSLDWHLSELLAYSYSGLKIETTLAHPHGVNGVQVNNVSSARSLLVLTTDPPTNCFDISSNDQTTPLEKFDLITTIVFGRHGDIFKLHSQIQGGDSTRQAHVIEKQFQHIFTLTGSSEDSRLGELKVLSHEDFLKIMEWNQRLPIAVDKCVDQMIQATANTNLMSEAIFASDGSMTYLELAGNSQIIAQNLQAIGIGPRSVVPLYFEKSKWIVVAILAVIKTGATFLLLDPSHPAKRLHYMVETAQAQFVLCSHSLAHTNVFGDLSILDVDALLKPPPTAWRKDDQLGSSPEGDLYIMFTSGTTGKPKAFSIQHRAFCTSATARAPLIRRDANSRVLQFCAFSFDPCIEDILTTLMFGGCICIPSDHERLNDLDGFIVRANVNAANVTPGVVDLLDPHDVPCLKVLILSGEAMKKRHIDTWAGRLTLMNGYGPSECCVKVALNPSVTINGDPKNIGRAVGSVLWIVDALQHQRLAPVGAVGELVVEGPTLSRGYLNTDTNQGAFVEAPKWLSEIRGDATVRIYRTGDLVKYNLDGTITFIGRRDTQVKIRGQRIELFEVEKTIAESLPSDWRVVAEAITFRGTDEPTLVAFLHKKQSTGGVASNSLPLFGQCEDVELSTIILGLDVAAKAALPSSMIPEAFIPIRYIPLTVHGKTDRATIRVQASELHKPRQTARRGL